MTENFTLIHDLLHHCWSHSRVITLRLRDGSERRGNVAEKPATGADWVQLHEHSRADRRRQRGRHGGIAPWSTPPSTDL